MRIYGVLIKGKQLTPTVRLLEALTRNACLADKLQWVDLPDSAKLLITTTDEDENAERRVWESKGFITFDAT